MSSNRNPDDSQFDRVNFLLRNNFMTFVESAFAELYPQAQFIDSQHIEVIAAKLEACESGRCKRLIICLPPRSLKSIITSVAFPAWVLGRDPHKQIICASYGQELAEKHARDTRTIMMSSIYQQAFRTRLSREKSSVNDFFTTGGGFRMATSVGGVLTGRGGDLSIADDTIKPTDAYSAVSRTAVNDWYDGTLFNRLNNKQDGVIIVVMQRLHQDDLVGHLLGKGDWDVLRFPAIAEEDENYEVESWAGRVRFHRKAGEVLDPRRETLATLHAIRSQMGSYAFEAQYQQNPQPVGGAIIKTAWLCSYTPSQLPPHFNFKIQSWDTANKSGELNDYSVCTTWGVYNRVYYLLGVFRKRLEYPELRRAVKDRYFEYRPRTLLIEDKGSGTQLLQDLRREGIYARPYSPPRGHDKPMRASAQSAVFEAGRVFLPASAPWLDDYVRELTGFPGTKYDDQVDSTTQALDYLTSSGGSGSCTIRELRM